MGIPKCRQLIALTLALVGYHGALQAASASVAQVAIPSLGDSDDQRTFGPPPGNETTNPEAWRLYTALTGQWAANPPGLEMNSSGNWFGTYLNGQMVTPDQMVSYLEQYQAALARVAKIVPSTDPSYQQMESAYNAAQKELEDYEAIMHTTYPTSGGSFSLQQLNIQPNSSSSNILTLYNQMLDGNSAAKAELSDIISSFQSHAGSITAQLSQAGKDRDGYWNSVTQSSDPGFVNGLLSPTSNFYASEALALVNLALTNPSAVSASDITFLNGTLTSRVMNEMLNTMRGNVSLWTQYFVSQGMSAALSIEVSTNLMSAFTAGFQGLQIQISSAASPSALFNLLLSAGQLTKPPTSFSAEQIGNFETVLNETSSLNAALQVVLGVVDGFQNEEPSLEYQLANAYGILQGRGEASSSLGQEILRFLSQVQKDKTSLGALLTQTGTLSSEMQSLLNGSLQSILSNTFAPSTFSAQVSSYQSGINAITQNSSYVELAKQVTSGSGGVSDFVKTLPAQLFPSSTPMVLPPAGNEGAWLDTSRLSIGGTEESFIAQLDSYFLQCANSGLSELKLSFTQFGSGNAADTLAPIFAAYGGPAACMQTMAIEAQKYGIKLGLSFGGEAAGSVAGSMKIPLPAAQYADQLITLFGSAIDSIDFDLEGADVTAFITDNSQEDIQSFFAELHKLAQGHNPPISIELTLTGSVGDQTPLAILFTTPPPFDKINLMMYDIGTCYYLSTTNPSWGTVPWIQKLVSECGVTPEQAMSMLSIGFQDKTPYNSANPTKTGANDPWPEQAAEEIQARTGRALVAMSSGEASYQLREQLELDTVAAWNAQNPSSPISAGASFAPANWWVDSTQSPIGSVLNLSEEAGMAAAQLEQQFGIPPY